MAFGGAVQSDQIGRAFASEAGAYAYESDMKYCTSTVIVLSFIMILNIYIYIYINIYMPQLTAGHCLGYQEL